MFHTNGFADTDVFDMNPGLVCSRGTGKTAVFTSGILRGGRVIGPTRVGGSAYRVGPKQGRILLPGVPEDPNLPHVRIYRVRPKYLTGDVSAEVA